MFTPSIKQSFNELETKAAPVYGQSVSFPEFLSSRGLEQLSAYAAITLYEQAMPLFNAIDIRATAFSEIPIKLYNKKTKEIITEHPVLDLLSAPNADMSQLEFLHAFSSYFDITGEVFLAATGRVTQPPLELMNVSPVIINFDTADRRFGLLNIPRAIQIQTHGVMKNYLATEDQQGLRFINKEQDNELWHIRSFNPRRSNGNFRGMSKARPIWMELQQYISGNKTNLSMLKRGTRLSMAWVNNSDTELTNTQWERMQEEAQKYSGDSNAGGTPILDGMDVKTIQQTNKDMEFGKLQDTMLARVSNIYDVPLALLLADTMTLSNLETAVLHLYDMGVLPLAKRLYAELTRFLLPRYPNSEDLEFVFREADIPAVRTRLIETTNRQKEIGVNTINELRGNIGDPDLGDKGDIVLILNTHIPLAEASLQDGDSKQELSAYEEFYTLMKRAVADNGERKYSDSAIINLALEKGLLNGN